MKKLLLSIAFLTTSFYSQAQVLLSDNFNSLTVGNIGTDITGATTGQGGFYTDAAGGAATNFQIVNEGGAYGNVVQLTGSSTATGTRYLWRDGLTAAWTGRTAGNDIIEVDYEFFTGPVTTSKNTVRVILYNSDYTKVLGGLSMVLDTKVISGLSYYDNAGTLGNYLFNLGSTPVALTANTWVRVGFSFNKTTGEVIFRGPGFDGSVPGAGAGTDPAEIDYIMTAGTGNALAGVGKYDNLVAKASATDTLLGVKSNQLTDAGFSVYPNPAMNVINFSNTTDAVVSSIEMTDMNGRIVKSEKVNATEGQISVSDLTTGMYMMKITTDQGTAVKKIVKQ